MGRVSRSILGLGGAWTAHLCELLIKGLRLKSIQAGGDGVGLPGNRHVLTSRNTLFSTLSPAPGREGRGGGAQIWPGLCDLQLSLRPPEPHPESPVPSLLPFQDCCEGVGGKKGAVKESCRSKVLG